MDGPAAPLITPFHDDFSVNHEALAAQVVRVARENCGVVLLGTTGEGGFQTFGELDPLEQVTLSPVTDDPWVSSSRKSLRG
jgi:dihydrodipicolinate synthase/N-acetylneuraminate lyase